MPAYIAFAQEMLRSILSVCTGEKLMKYDIRIKKQELFKKKALLEY